MRDEIFTFRVVEGRSEVHTVYQGLPCHFRHFVNLHLTAGPEIQRVAEEWPSLSDRLETKKEKKKGKGKEKEELSPRRVAADEVTRAKRVHRARGWSKFVKAITRATRRTGDLYIRRKKKEREKEIRIGAARRSV